MLVVPSISKAEIMLLAFNQRTSIMSAQSFCWSPGGTEAEAHCEHLEDHSGVYLQTLWIYRCCPLTKPGDLSPLLQELVPSPSTLTYLAREVSGVKSVSFGRLVAYSSPS